MQTTRGETENGEDQAHAVVPSGSGEHPGSKAEARAAWMGFIGPLVGVILLFLFVGEYAESPKQETQLLHGGLIGLGLSAFLGFALAYWTAKMRKKTANPLLPMAMGFLSKLIFLGLGMFLLARPLKGLGSFEAYGLGFIFGAFSFQLLFAFLSRPRN